MIDLEGYRADEYIAVPSIVTLEGDPRGGKGTCAEAAKIALEEDGRNVLLIDQGQKFRVLALLADEQNVALDDRLAVERFLEADDMRPMMLERLGEVALLTPPERKNLLYTSDLNRGSSLVGGVPVSQPLATDLLYDQVAEASDNDIDHILIDGRKMQKHGEAMHHQKLGLYAMGIFFECDSLAAAQRQQKDFRELDEMPVTDQLQLLRTITQLFERNGNDMSRKVEPVTRAHLAYRLDMLHGLPSDPAERAMVLDEMFETGMVAVDATHVAEEPMKAIAVEVIRHALHQAELIRDGHNQPVHAGLMSTAR